MYSPPRPGAYLEIFDLHGQRQVPLTQKRHVLGDEASCDIQLYSGAPLEYQTVLIWRIATYRALDVDLNLPGRQVAGVDLKPGDRIIFADDVTATYCRSDYPPAGSTRLLRPPASPPSLPPGTARSPAVP